MRDVALVVGCWILCFLLLLVLHLLIDGDVPRWLGGPKR